MMDYLNDYADYRLVNGCIYCGRQEDTREHVPSKILLIKPFPTNLPIMGACFECNNGFSKDEEYVACLIACMVSGSTDPSVIYNTRIANHLKKNNALRNRIHNAISEIDGKLTISIEEKRLKNVIHKLAIGHAAYELSKILRENPSFLEWCFLDDFSEEERGDFDSPHFTDVFDEIGSRNIQRQTVTEMSLQSDEGNFEKVGFVSNDWLVVQENYYRFHAVSNNDGVLIKIVFSEFLVAVVFWENEF